MSNNPALRPHSRMVGYGTMTVVAILVLFFGWEIFVNTQLKMDHLTVEFQGESDVISSLQPDDPVAIQGVTVGQVEEVSSHGRAVRVSLRFWTSQRIFRDARATNAGTGLMGMRFVLVDPARDTAHPLDRDSAIPGLFLPGVAEVMSRIENVVSTVKNLQTGMALLQTGDAANPALSKKFERLLRQADTLLDQSDRMMGRLDRVGPVLTKVGGQTRALGQNLDQFGPEMVVALRDVDTVLQDARRLVASTRSTAHAADTMVRGVDQTIAPFARSDSLLQSIQAGLSAVDKLEALVQGRSAVKFNFHVLGDNPSRHGE